MNVVYCKNGHYIAAYNVGGHSWHQVVTSMVHDEREDAPHREVLRSVRSE